jgi:hypothetical protein
MLDPDPESMNPDPKDWYEGPGRWMRYRRDEIGWMRGIGKSRMGKWFRSKEEGEGGEGEEGVSSSEKEVDEKLLRVAGGEGSKKSRESFPLHHDERDHLARGGGVGGVRACTVCIKANVQAVKTDVHYL